MINTFRGVVLFLVLAIAGLVYYFENSPVNTFERVRRQFSSSLPNKCVNNGDIAITIDNGPSVFTSSVLKALQNEGVKATFHIDTEWLENAVQSAFTAEIVRQGHVLGLAFNPPIPVQNLSDEDLRARLRQDSEKIKEIAGVYPRFIRLKFNQATPEAVRRVESFGYYATSFSVDTQDYSLSVQQIIEQRYKATFDLLQGLKGSFIFQHNDLSPIGEAVAGGIREGKKNGYNFVTIAQCMGETGVYKTGPESTSFVNSETATGGSSGGSGNGNEGSSGAPSLNSQAIMAVTLVFAALYLAV